MQFDQQMQIETELRTQQQRTTSPKKARAQTAKSPAKKSAVKTVQRTASISVTGGFISSAYMEKGLTEMQVEYDHLKTVETEV